jgi:hypothetical protein
MGHEAKTIVCGCLVAICVGLAALPGYGALGDCSQPRTDGGAPTATDCLAILSVAVGAGTCDPFPACVCAPKGTTPTTATDSLVCLRAAVESPAVLTCPCATTSTTSPPTTAPTTTTSTTTTTTTTSTSTTTIRIPDVDGDGWTPAEGDCCDAPGDGCAVPALVNPGAFDFPGDGVDEDCNGVADDSGVSCDDALASDTSDAADYAKALDVCSSTTETPPKAEQRYGLISAALSLADGSGVPAVISRAIRPSFGGVTARRGSSMTVLATGSAAAPGQIDPAYAAFEPGTSTGTSSGVPVDWLAANGGEIPSAPGCPPVPDTIARDAVMLKLRLRVPTNAFSLSLAANLLTAEFPEWVCSSYNDRFVVLLNSAAQTNPADGNLAVYTSPGDLRYPVGVNLAKDDTGLFRQCRNGTIGCNTDTPSTISTCTDTAELAGSGFDEPSPGCDDPDTVGGATGWLVIRGNVTPGEVAELSIALWDSRDAIYDTVVILDALAWGRDPVAAGAGLDDSSFSARHSEHRTVVQAHSRQLAPPYAAGVEADHSVLVRARPCEMKCRPMPENDARATCATARHGEPRK